MTIRTLALDSGVTSIQDHRLALGAFMAPGSSALERRGGLYYYPGAADLVSAAALQATVSPFVAVVDGTSNSLQGQVVVVVDTAVTLTFSAGEPSVARTDRVVLQVRDTTYDASGSTDARVLIVKGNTSTGAANSVPASSLLLWEVVVPIGASSITFSSARVDRRQWIATPMRIPVNSQTERDALPAIPGLEVTRLDTGDVQQLWSSAWRTIAPAAAPTSAVLLAYKTADTTRSATGRSSDPHLTLAVEANKNYLFQAVIFFQNSTSAVSLSLDFVAPAGSGGKFQQLFVDSSAALSGSIYGAYWAFNLANTVPSGNANAMAASFTGLLRTGGTAGSLTFSWAPSTATSVTVRDHSFMRLEKVS